jgi:hypothetical protein
MKKKMFKLIHKGVEASFAFGEVTPKPPPKKVAEKLGSTLLF